MKIITKKSYFLSSKNIFVATYKFPRKWVVYAGYFRGIGDCEPYNHNYAYKCHPGSEYVTELSFRDRKLLYKAEYHFTKFSESFITNERKVAHGIPKVLWDAIEERKLGWKFRNGTYPKGWVSMGKTPASSYKTQIVVNDVGVCCKNKYFVKF